MTDPLDRDKFPDRPTGPEFARLCLIALRQDALSHEGGGVEQVIAESGIPEKDLVYFLQRLGLDLSVTMIAAVMLDAFTIGHGYGRGDES